MMLEIVNFYDETQIGGGYVPAFALERWCQILNFDCKLRFRVENEGDVLFLATPGPLKGKMDMPTKPFLVMIHAEFDQHVYPYFRELISHKLCKAIVVIGMNYWSIPKPQFYWHPCTMPEYLLKEEDEFQKHTPKLGLVYAARISRWKGINKLAALSMYSHFYSKVDNTITVYGTQTSKFPLEEGRYILMNQNLNSLDIDSFSEVIDKYKYFWDVSGAPDYPIDIPRLNLAAVEAMKFGVVPIADANTCYPFAKDWIVDLRRGFPKSFYDKQMYMFDKAIKSPMSYNAVEKDVCNILNFITDEAI